MPDDLERDCRELYLLMRTFWNLFGHRMNSVLTRGGINVPQYMAMVALMALGETTMSQLSKKLWITMGAATNIVDKLVRGGYASRNRSTKDRRVVRVRLSAKGQETLTGIEESAVAFLSAALSDITSEQRADFIRTHQDMIALAKEKEPPAARHTLIEDES